MSDYIVTGVEQKKVFCVLRLKVVNAATATIPTAYPTGRRTLTVQRKRSLSQGQSSNFCLWCVKTSHMSLFLSLSYQHDISQALISFQMARKYFSAFVSL